MATMATMAGMQAQLGPVAASSGMMPIVKPGLAIQKVGPPKLSAIAPRPAGVERQTPLLASSGQLGNATKKKRPRLSTAQRLERSRERNRIHARKTRQRKKMVMSQMQERLKELHQSSVKLRQIISERKTANILLSMSAVPDSELPQLPVPIEFNPDDLQNVKSEVLDRLTGTRKRKSTELKDIEENLDDANDDEEEDSGSGADDSPSSDEDCEDGKGAESFTKKENEKIFPDDDGTTDPTLLEEHRRQRNRMHAKRTRVRRKHIMDETRLMIERLGKQNSQLLAYLNVLENGKPQSMNEPTVEIRQEKETSPVAVGVANVLAALAESPQQTVNDES